MPNGYYTSEYRPCLSVLNVAVQFVGENKARGHGDHVSAEKFPRQTRDWNSHLITPPYSTFLLTFSCTSYCVNSLRRESLTFFVKVFRFFTSWNVLTFLKRYLLEYFACLNSLRLEMYEYIILLVLISFECSIVKVLKILHCDVRTCFLFFTSRNYFFILYVLKMFKPTPYPWFLREQKPVQYRWGWIFVTSWHGKQSLQPQYLHGIAL